VIVPGEPAGEPYFRELLRSNIQLVSAHQTKDATASWLRNEVLVEWIKERRMREVGRPRRESRGLLFAGPVALSLEPNFLHGSNRGTLALGIFHRHCPAYINNKNPQTTYLGTLIVETCKLTLYGASSPLLIGTLRASSDNKQQSNSLHRAFHQQLVTQDHGRGAMRAVAPVRKYQRRGATKYGHQLPGDDDNHCRRQSDNGSLAGGERLFLESDGFFEALRAHLRAPLRTSSTYLIPWSSQTEIFQRGNALSRFVYVLAHRSQFSFVFTNELFTGFGSMRTTNHDDMVLLYLLSCLSWRNQESSFNTPTPRGLGILVPLLRVAWCQLVRTKSFSKRIQAHLTTSLGSWASVQRYDTRNCCCYAHNKSSSIIVEELLR
jgi:hypothetical protein